MANEIRTVLRKSLKTKAPSGLTITRNGNSFVCQWKKSDKDYDDGQQFQYKVGNGAWTSVSIGTGATSKTFSINPALYYPFTQKILTSVRQES